MNNIVIFNFINNKFIKVYSLKNQESRIKKQEPRGETQNLGQGSSKVFALHCRAAGAVARCAVPDPSRECQGVPSALGVSTVVAHCHSSPHRESDAFGGFGCASPPLAWVNGMVGHGVFKIKYGSCCDPRPFDP